MKSSIPFIIWDNITSLAKNSHPYDVKVSTSPRPVRRVFFSAALVGKGRGAEVRHILTISAKLQTDTVVVNDATEICCSFYA